MLELLGCQEKVNYNEKLKEVWVERDSCGHDGPVGDCLVGSCVGWLAVGMHEMFCNELASILVLWGSKSSVHPGRQWTQRDGYDDCEI